jgi:hypothetical protein
MANDAGHVLGLAAARRARQDAMRDGAAGRVIRGDGGYAPHGGAAASLALINSRGAASVDSLNGPARPVKPDVLDWSIISAWQ